MDTCKNSHRLRVGDLTRVQRNKLANTCTVTLSRIALQLLTRTTLQPKSLKATIMGLVKSQVLGQECCTKEQTSSSLHIT